MPETTEEEVETPTAFLARVSPLLRGLDPELRAQVDQAIELGGDAGLTALANVGPVFARLVFLATSQNVSAEVVLGEVAALYA